MLCDQKENKFTASLLLPAFNLEDFVLVINLWCLLPQNEFQSEVDNSINELKIAGDIIRTHLKDYALEGIFGNSDAHFIRSPQFINPLSPREKEVLQWLSTGLRSDEIAFRMNITLPTVNFHLNSIRSKLGAKTREQALAIALTRRFIQP